MKKRIIFCAAALLLIITSQMPLSAETFPEDPKPVTPTKKTALFNGRNYNGWDIFMRSDTFADSPDKVFTVKDGAMHVTGKGYGGCTTVKAYKDYHLTMEFRFVGDATADRVGKTADGGLLFHCVGPEGAWNGIWHLSFECNIIQGRTADLIVVGDGKAYPNTLYAKAYVDEELRWTPDSSKGKLLELKDGGRVNSSTYDPTWEDVDKQPSVYPEKPYGEWNTLELICDGDTAEYILNGVTVLKLFGLNPSSGRIQLQSECHAIEYRNIYIDGLTKQTGR